MRRTASGAAIALLIVNAHGCGDDLSRPDEPGPMLYGTVVSVAEDAPLSGVEIFVVEGARYTVVAGPVETDSTGSYSFDALPGGKHYVFAFHSDLLLFDRTARSVTLDPEASIGHDLRMIRSEAWDGHGYAIEGRVLDAETEAPIEGAFVSGFFAAIRHSFIGVSLPFEAITGADGRFRLEGVSVVTDEMGNESGLMPIGATKEGYEAAFSTSIPLPEGPDSLAHQDILLFAERAAGSIEGRILLDGDPRPGIHVGLDYYRIWSGRPDAGNASASRAIPYLGKSTVTDSIGRYRFDSLPAGFYTVLPAYLPDDGFVAPLRPEMQGALADSQSVVVPDVSIAVALRALAPEPGSTISDSEPRLRWEIPGDADRVVVHLGTGHFVDTIYDGPARAELQPPEPLPAGSNVRWLVEAYREGETVGEFEEAATFRVRDRDDARSP